MTDNWLELARRTTAAEREHRRRADELWQTGDVIAALSDRRTADGLAAARDLQLEVSQQAAGPSPEDSAWFSVWLHGNWHFLTKKMTTEEREVAAEAVQRHSDHLSRVDGERPSALGGLRWWSE